MNNSCGHGPFCTASLPISGRPSESILLSFRLKKGNPACHALLLGILAWGSFLFCIRIQQVWAQVLFPTVFERNLIHIHCPRSSGFLICLPGYGKVGQPKCLKLELVTGLVTAETDFAAPIQLQHFKAHISGMCSDEGVR